MSVALPLGIEMPGDMKPNEPKFSAMDISGVLQCWRIRTSGFENTSFFIADVGEIMRVQLMD